MRATSFCQRHFDYEHPRFRSVIRGRYPRPRPSCEVPLRGPTDAWRVSRRPTHFGPVGFHFSTRAFSSRGVDRAVSSDAPFTALRLPSLCIALARRLSPAGGDPLTCGERRLREHGQTTRLRRPVTDPASTDDPERLPSDGRSLAPRGLPPAAFRFGTPPRSPGAARVHDDDAVRPTSATTIRS